MERTQNLPESAIAVEASSSLDDLVREDARKMLMTVRGAEVRAFIQVYSDERTQQGRRLVVRDGQLTPRQIMTGAGPLEVEQPLVRDRRGKGDPLAVRFISKVLPPYLKRSQPVTNICPWLYLKGIPTRGFQKALQSLVGADAADLSASTVSRLTRAWAEEHESWSHRDHRGKRSVCRLIRRNIVQPSSPGLRRITDPIQEHGSLAGHGRPSRMNQKDLTAALKKLGARDPERWARSQIEEGLPQLARYLFLRQAWRNIVKEDDPGWIEDSIERARTHPNEPYAGVGHAQSL